MSSRQLVSANPVTLADSYLSVSLDGDEARFHYVWLRDNCWCVECRVAQTGERRLFTAHIRSDIAAASATWVEPGQLEIEWNDGHVSRYGDRWLIDHDYSRPTSDRDPNSSITPPITSSITLWRSDSAHVPRFEHSEVVSSDAAQLAYLDAVCEYGVAVVANTPSVSGEVERFAEVIGHVRETAFERVHNVRHDPAGYNVAHTALELKPHTDLPSYHWPPSIQLLHFLVNESNGGESTVTDGWAIIADLRRDDPDAFDTLCRVPVGFQLFSDDEDTSARSPIIQLDVDGKVVVFRFSNQLAVPLDVPFDDVEPFYAAYRRLGLMVDSDKYKHAFKTSNGDLLTVHAHRVMHGRKEFDPASGRRHLQDVYMEFDDFAARRRVLRGGHKPMPSTTSDRMEAVDDLDEAGTA